MRNGGNEDFGGAGLVLYNGKIIALVWVPFTRQKQGTPGESWAVHGDENKL